MEFFRVFWDSLGIFEFFKEFLGDFSKDFWNIWQFFGFSGFTWDYLPSILSAMVAASLASPRKTGEMGWFSPRIVNPAAVIPSRNLFVLVATFSNSPPPLVINSNACKSNDAIQVSRCFKANLVIALAGRIRECNNK